MTYDRLELNIKLCFLIEKSVAHDLYVLTRFYFLFNDYTLRVHWL